MQAASGVVGLEKEKPLRVASVEEFQSPSSTSVVQQQLLPLEEARLGGHWLESKIIIQTCSKLGLGSLAAESRLENVAFNRVG